MVIRFRTLTMVFLLLGALTALTDLTVMPNAAHASSLTLEDEAVTSSSAYRQMLKSFEVLEKDIAAGENANRITRNAQKVEKRIAKLLKKFPDLDVTPLKSRLGVLTGGDAAPKGDETGVGQDTLNLAQQRQQIDAILAQTGFTSNPIDALKSLEAGLAEIDFTSLQNGTPEAQQLMAELEARLMQSPLMADARQSLMMAQAEMQTGQFDQAKARLDAVGGVFTVFADVLSQSGQLKQMTMMHQQMDTMIQQMAPELATAVRSGGPVVFASRSVDPGARDQESQPRFDDEAIYATLFLSKPIQKLNGDGLFILNAKVAGQSQRFELYVPESDLQNSFLEFPIAPFPSWFETERPTLGKGQVEFLNWINSALSADKDAQRIDLSFLRLGGTGNEIKTSFEVSAGAREFYRQTALRAQDILNAGNVLFNVGQKDPALEARLMQVVQSDARFADLEVRRVLLWDRTWLRIYGADRETITGRKITAGIVGRDKDDRYQMRITAFAQDIDQPRQDIYNPEDLTDDLFRAHPVGVASIERDPVLLSAQAALAEVEVRKVIALSPVTIHNTLNVAVRVDSGGQKQTFPPGKRGNFNYEAGMPVAIRDQGSRLIKMVREEEFLATGLIVVP